MTDIEKFLSKIVKINELDTNHIYIIELSKDLPKE